MRLLGEIRAGMLEVVAYQNEPNTLGLQMRTSTYQDRGGVLLCDCQRLAFILAGEDQSFVQIFCANGEVHVNRWGIHATIFPKNSKHDKK